MGALHAFYLKIKYLPAVLMATYFASVFIFVGKVAIIAGNAFLFKLVVEKVTGEADELSSLAGPMIVVCLVTYIFVSMFIGMFDESVNAMLTSVAIDSNCHGGTPVYGPETFNNKINFDENGVKLAGTKDKDANELE